MTLANDTNDYNKCFIMTNDINLTSYTFTTAVIAKDNNPDFYFQGTIFTGIFDGAGHKITNLTIDTNGAGNYYLGLFGDVNNGGEIKNLGLQNTLVKGGQEYIGGLAGANGDRGNIINCYSDSNISGTMGTGGLVGRNNGNINNSYSTGSVNIGPGGDGGGLVGDNWGIITNCFSTCEIVYGGYPCQGIGGLVGFNHDSGNINRSFSTGPVAGGSFRGGLVGENWGNISNCYSTSTLSGETESSCLGGLVGDNVGFWIYSGTITNCYSMGSVPDVNSLCCHGGLVGDNSGTILGSCFLDTAGPHNGFGTPLTDFQMKQQASFVGWDFINVWKIDEGVDYPKLAWSMKYSGGSGEPNDPYQIANVADLLTLSADANDYNKCFIMTADIDLDPCLPGGQVFTTAVIARDTNDSNDFQGNPFTGIFNGAGHKILNPTIDTNGVGNWYLGLFGNINTGGEIKNLVLQDVNITGGYRSSYIGGLAGQNDGNISNCSLMGSINGGTNYSPNIGGLTGCNIGNIDNSCSTGSVTGRSSDSSNIGGLAGINFGSIDYCFSTSNVSGGNYLGGLAGLNSGSIRNSYSTGSISSEFSTDLGGLVGHNSGSIDNCYATGNIINNITISWNLGGLVGYNEYGSISNSYSKGNVTGANSSYYLGGLVGENGFYSTIRNCYSTGIVTGGSPSTYAGGLIGYNYDYSGGLSGSYFLITSGPNNGCGTPLTDAQMKQQASFVGWDFNDMWAICESTNYPRLIWQIPKGDLICPNGVDFTDFSFFVQRWLYVDCAGASNCDGTDLDISGRVDFIDFALIAQNWLQGY